MNFAILRNVDCVYRLHPTSFTLARLFIIYLVQFLSAKPYFSKTTRMWVITASLQEEEKEAEQA